MTSGSAACCRPPRYSANHKPDLSVAVEIGVGSTAALIRQRCKAVRSEVEGEGAEVSEGMLEV